MRAERKILIFIAIMLAAASLVYLFGPAKDNRGPKETEIQKRIENKSKKLQVAPNFEAIKEPLMEKKIVLLYFFTGSCPNCEAVAPHINAWYKKYFQPNLQFVGIYTPEFEYQKDGTDLKNTIEKLDIEYPVVADSNSQILAAYKNDAWPKVYIIDQDGFIEYSHAGEGAYYQTEANLRFVLNEKNKEKNASLFVDMDQTLPPIPESTDNYFGSGRNTKLGNGDRFSSGIQKLTAPKSIKLNELYLVGNWEFKEEHAENRLSEAKIILKYNAKEVYLMAGSREKNKLTILNDGEKGEIEISTTGLYNLVTNEDIGEHTLEITIPKPGLQAYVLRFR